MLRRQFLATAASAVALVAFAPAVGNAADDPLSVVKAYMDAWNAHDSAKAASHFAENVVYFDASVGKPIDGKEAAKMGVIDNFLNAAPDAKWVVKGEPIVQGDRIAFEWEFSGINTGDWGDGTKATGKPFSFVGSSIFSIKDGKIAHQSDFYDALGFYKQLGLM